MLVLPCGIQLVAFYNSGMQQRSVRLIIIRLTVHVVSNGQIFLLRQLQL